MDYIKKGQELVKRMLNSEQRATCESDGTERAYINSNWLIMQRASLLQNAHLEREEIIREAESRQSLVKNGGGNERADMLPFLFCPHKKPFKYNSTGCSSMKWKRHMEQTSHLHSPSLNRWRKWVQKWVSSKTPTQTWKLIRHKLNRFCSCFQKDLNLPINRKHTVIKVVKWWEVRSD